jgi:ferritin-like metal-binding protein YciE
LFRHDLLPPFLDLLSLKTINNSDLSNESYQEDFKHSSLNFQQYLIYLTIKKMKKIFLNLKEALIYQLKGLYDAEKKLQKKVLECTNKVTSATLKDEIKKYVNGTNTNIAKLERVFSDLSEDPTTRDNMIIDKMLEDLQHMLKYAASDQLRDVLIISCIQNINHFKISGYGTACALALELELETISGTLHQMLSWEKQTDRILSKIAMEEVNAKAVIEPEVKSKTS